MSSIVSLLASGGILVYPLIFCALLGLVLILERTYFWLKITYNYSTHDVEHVYTLMVHKQYDDAKEVLENSKDPSLLCLRHCLASKGRIHSKILQSLAQQKLDQAKKMMNALETITTISPLIGILGTVFGIIRSSSGLNLNSTEAYDGQAMIAGLSEALVSTALGLVVTIICLVAYGHFTSRIEFLRSKLERDLSAFESLVS